MKKGFVFIETIIVVTILTVALMSIYVNYSKIISNTKELNTFDTAEYNYKTAELKKLYNNGKITGLNENECKKFSSSLSDNGEIKICLLKNAFFKLKYLEDEIDSGVTYPKYKNIDAYIIDYLNNQDWTEYNDNIFLVEYKMRDKQTDEYFTYISSLNY